MAGSGLPIPESGVIAQGPGVVDGDGLTSARSWASIAASGAKLANAAGNYLEQEHRQALIGRLADRDTTDRANAIELEDKFREDPAGFQNAWKAYREGVLQSIEPDLVPHARATLGSLGNSVFSSILDRKRTRDRQQDGERVGALIEATGNDLTALGLRGELGTEKGKITASKLKGVIDSAVSSGLMTAEKGALRLNEILGAAQSESVLFSAKQAYDDARASGSDALGAARKVVEERILNNADLPLSAADRRAYAAKISSELGAEEALRRQDLSIARKAATDAQAAMQGGVRVSPETIDSLADQLSANGGQADAARLRAAAARADQVRSFGQLPLAQQNEVFAAASSGVSPGLVDKIIGAESGGNAAATNPNSSATGAGQFIGATWLDIVRRNRPDLAAGKSDEQVLALRTDPKLSREMTSRYVQENAAALRQASVPVNDGTVYLAHFLGAGGAVKVLKANPDAPIKGIVGEQAYAANQTKGGTFVGGETAGAVRSWAARKVGADAGIGGDAESDLRFAREAQSELSKSVARDWKKISADLDAGVRPAPDALAALINGATLAGDSDLLENIGERLDRYDVARNLERGSLGEQQAAVSGAEQAGVAGVLPPGRSAWIKDFASVRDATIAGLDRDPVALVAQRFPDRFKAPAPLDVTNSSKLQEGLRQRAQMAQFGQQIYGTPALSALGPADMAAVQSVLDGPDPIAKARVLAEMSRALPDDIRLATFAKMGTKGPAAALASFAGGLMPRDPEVANGILRGGTALAAEPRYAPKEGTEGAAFKEGLDAALPASAFGPAARTGETGGYAILREAVRSRYADLAATVGDASGKLDERRLQRAVDDVTGGVLTHNGSALIAPTRGTSQAQFDAVMFGITSNDLAGVQTLSGSPVTPEYLRGSAKLETIGDGRYLVRLNNDPARPSYAVKASGNPAAPPAPFVLDLRDRRPATIPSWASSPPAAGGPAPSWNYYGGPAGGLDSSGVTP